MNKEPNRIYFIDNPYPNGHKISKFIWSGRLDENEDLWFDFHLETEKYYTNDEINTEDEEEESESSWKSKGVWTNYGRCILSSTFWGGEDKGIKINTKGEKFKMDNYLQQTLIADNLPLEDDYDEDELALNIYLLGHDSCANHSIKFNKNQNDYDIEWTGKIALTYCGDYDFEHDFTAVIQNVKFDGFHFPKEWTLEKVKEVFEKIIDDFDKFEFIDLNPKSNIREYKLSPLVS